MGSLKDIHLQHQESSQLNLSEALGISWAQLEKLNYKIQPKLSKEGKLRSYLISFDNSCDAHILSQIEGLNRLRTIELSPWVFERSYVEEYELGAISQNIDHEASFLQELDASLRLQNLKVEDHETRKILLRQIFVSIIGAIETFLSDQFISRTLSSEWYIEAFVASHPEFRKQKVSVSEVFSVSRTIRERAKTIMVGTIYHKLPVVREMYTKTFDIKFPDISEIQKYVLIRHDLVHRNGKTTDGKLVKVDDKLVNQLREAAENFVKSVVLELTSKFEWDDDIPF